METEEGAGDVDSGDKAGSGVGREGDGEGGSEAEGEGNWDEDVVVAEVGSDGGLSRLAAVGDFDLPGKGFIRGNLEYERLLQVSLLI